MSDQIPTGLGTFTNLPPELRDEIYHLLIHAHNLNILQVSTTMYKEASEIFFKDQTCRMNFGFDNFRDRFFPTKALADKILNIFDGRFTPWGLWERCDRQDIEHIRLFAGSDIPGKVCIASFMVFAGCIQLFDPKVLEVLTLLTGFETMILECRIQMSGAIQHARSWREVETLSENRFSSSLVMAKEILEPTLGPAEVAIGEEREGRYIYRNMYQHIYPLRKFAEGLQRRG